MVKSALVAAFVAGVVVAGVPAPGFAQSEPAPSTFHREVRGQLGASINNAGLQHTLDVVWTRPLTASTQPLLADAHISVGLTHAVTPSQTRLGGWVEYSPLSIVDIRAGFEPSLYFGTFDSLMGFNEYDEPFDPDARRVRGGAGMGLSSRAYLAPTMKYKVGRVVASSTLGVEWWRSNIDAEYFYEPTRDTLLDARGDRLTTVTSALLYELGTSSAPLRFGAYHSWNDVSDARANRIEKLGAVVTKQFASPHFRIPKPSVTLLVANYLQDRYKKGEWTAAIAVGFKR